MQFYLSLKFFFQVIIKGGPNIFLRHGSPGQLDCVFTRFVISPTEVEWRFNGRIVDRSRYSRLSQRLHKNSSEEYTKISLSRLTSWLKVEEGGNYSCQVEGVVDNIKVKVIRTKEAHQLPITNAGIIWHLRSNLVILIIKCLMMLRGEQHCL